MYFPYLTSSISPPPPSCLSMIFRARLGYRLYGALFLVVAFTAVHSPYLMETTSLGKITPLTPPAIPFEAPSLSLGSPATRRLLSLESSKHSSVTLLRSSTPSSSPSSSSSLPSPPPSSPSIIICNESPSITRLFYLIGIIISWVSGLLYAYSRIPQILLNYQRYSSGLSIDGLSPVMFILALTANFAYGISIFVRQPPMDLHFFTVTISYLIGSLGTLFLDLVILGQIWYYRRRPSLSSSPSLLTTPDKAISDESSSIQSSSTFTSTSLATSAASSTNGDLIPSSSTLAHQLRYTTCLGADAFVGPDDETFSRATSFSTLHHQSPLKDPHDADKEWQKHQDILEKQNKMYL